MASTLAERVLSRDDLGTVVTVIHQSELGYEKAQPEQAFIVELWKNITAIKRPKEPHGNSKGILRLLYHEAVSLPIASLSTHSVADGFKPAFLYDSAIPIPKGDPDYEWLNQQISEMIS